MDKPSVVEGNLRQRSNLLSDLSALFIILAMILPLLPFPSLYRCARSFLLISSAPFHSYFYQSCLLAKFPIGFLIATPFLNCAILSFPRLASGHSPNCIWFYGKHPKAAAMYRIYTQQQQLESLTNKTCFPATCCTVGGDSIVCIPPERDSYPT